MEDNRFVLLVVLSASLMDVCTCIGQRMSLESWWMSGWRAKSRRLCTPPPYVFIHLRLMQQPRQRRGSGTLCWRPNESWVIYHVKSQGSSPARTPYTTPSWFFISHPFISSFIYCFSLLHYSYSHFVLLSLCFRLPAFPCVFISSLRRHFSTFPSVPWTPSLISFHFQIHIQPKNSSNTSTRVLPSTTTQNMFICWDVLMWLTSWNFVQISKIYFTCPPEEELIKRFGRGGVHFRKLGQWLVDGWTCHV